jgi:hypothetical protein
MDDKNGDENEGGARVGAIDKRRRFFVAHSPQDN